VPSVRNGCDCLVRRGEKYFFRCGSSYWQIVQIDSRFLCHTQQRLFPSRLSHLQLSGTICAQKNKNGLAGLLRHQSLLHFERKGRRSDRPASGQLCKTFLALLRMLLDEQGEILTITSPPFGCMTVHRTHAGQLTESAMPGVGATDTSRDYWGETTAAGQPRRHLPRAGSNECNVPPEPRRRQVRRATPYSVLETDGHSRPEIG